MVKQRRKLRKLSIPKEHIATLGEDRIAMLAAFSFHISEINVFWRVHNSCTQQTTSNTDINFAIAIQKNTILRVWASKIFEFLEGLPNKSNDQELLAFVLKIKAKLKLASVLGGPKDSFAGRVRHETAFHLDLEAIRKRLHFTSKDATTDFFFDSVEGNSFFPFGEEAVFATTFNRYVASIPKGEQLDVLDGWLAWIVAASRDLIYLFDEFLVDFVFTDKASPNWQWIEIEMEKDMVAKLGEKNIPMFFQVEDTP